MNNDPKKYADQIKNTIMGAILLGLSPSETAKILSHSDDALDHNIAQSLDKETYDQETENKKIDSN